MRKVISGTFLFRGKMTRMFSTKIEFDELDKQSFLQSRSDPTQEYYNDIDNKKTDDKITTKVDFDAYDDLTELAIRHTMYDPPNSNNKK